jgi:hypothetical protein
MNSLKYRGIVEQLQSSEHSIALRKRVELLEQLREGACLHRERSEVDTIDEQIKHAVCEWIDSLIAGIEAEVKEREGGTKAA